MVKLNNDWDELLKDEFQKEYFGNSSEDAEGFKDDSPLAGSGYFEIKYKIKYKNLL